ncbi:MULTISPECIES: hypothetical protein [unclassified Lysinibacillus]|uniref:hypothetical protein n=1 Tax=unclassified Lysinibacillus TaxID=2636778 RepID=UPI0030F6242D
MSKVFCFTTNLVESLYSADGLPSIARFVLLRLSNMFLACQTIKDIATNLTYR